MNTLNLEHLIREIVLSQPDRDMQYKALTLALDIDRHTAKKMLFQWIWRAGHTQLHKTLMEYVKSGA